MAFMGYETPVEMPSMRVYNTDLMKMYIAGVKEQYEQAREEMKDFMKLYLDFYSDVPGQTERYNDLTTKGAMDLINKMYAQGIDPYKSPEARAIISLYIAGVPTGELGKLKRSAENAKEYKKNRDKLILAGLFDPEYEKWRLGGKTLETWDPNLEFTETTPYAAQDWASVAAPYLKEFDKTEWLKSDREGYTKWGVSDENQKKGVDAVMNAASSTPWLQYKLRQAYDRTAGMRDENGAPLSEEQRKLTATLMVRREVEDTATQYYQPKYEVDPYYLDDYKRNNAIKLYWSTTGSNSGGGKGNGGDNGGYLAIHDAATRGIASKIQTQFGIIDYASYQLNAIKNSAKPNDALTTMSFDVSPTLFSSFMNRSSIGGSSNVVAYENGDSGTVYSASEIMEKMQGRPSGFSSTSYGKDARKHMSRAYKLDPANGVTRTATGKGVGVLEDDGLVHIYLLERDKSVIRGTNKDGNPAISTIGNDLMYMDTGYRYDPETWEVVENLSINAIARDARATKTAYSQPLKKLK